MQIYDCCWKKNASKRILSNEGKSLSRHSLFLQPTLQIQACLLVVPCRSRFSTRVDHLLLEYLLGSRNIRLPSWPYSTQHIHEKIVSPGRQTLLATGPSSEYPIFSSSSLQCVWLLIDPFF